MNDELRKKLVPALAGLREEFLTRLAGQWKDLSSLNARGAQAWGEEAYVTVYRAAHTMAGTAGLFGLAELERLARQVEGALSPKRATAPEIQQSLGQLLAEIETLVPRVPGDAEPREGRQSEGSGGPTTS